MTTENKTYTPEQQAENRAKWVAALRSGDYPQTVGYLQDKDGLCCLGVACAIAASEGVIEPPTAARDLIGGTRERGIMDFDGQVLALPSAVALWLGLASVDGRLIAPVGAGDGAPTLAEANDDLDYTFEQLADLIESGKVVVRS